MWRLPWARRVFSSVPGLYPLDASSTLPQLVTTKNVLRDCQMIPGGQNQLLRTRPTVNLRFLHNSVLLQQPDDDFHPTHKVINTLLRSGEVRPSLKARDGEFSTYAGQWLLRISQVQ